MNNLPDGTDVVTAIDNAEFTLVDLTVAECEKLAAILKAFGATNVAYGDTPGDTEDAQGLIGSGFTQANADRLLAILRGDF